MKSTKILVTGGAGYIGSHVCKSLSAHGYIPVTYDNLCSGNRGAVLWGPLVEGDITNSDQLGRAFRKYQPRAIIHLAGLLRVEESVRDPAPYYHNNVSGSLCLLEEARQHNVEHIVFSSSAAVYGKPSVSPIPEETPSSPINPYGRTKDMVERIIKDYAAAYGLRYAILRYFNAAGADPELQTGAAYKTNTHIIPLLMQVANGDLSHIKLFGQDYMTHDGTAVRDYIHVSDLAMAHTLALQHLLSGKESLIINTGTSRGHSVMDVIRATRRVTGHPIPVDAQSRRAGDPPVLVADSRKIQNVLGWKPVSSEIDVIIETAWRWQQSRNQRRLSA